MKKQLNILFLSPAKDYIATLSASEQGTISADIKIMEIGDFDSVNTKQLRGPIRELIIDYHRLIYFGIGNTLYFISGFRKKSRKTPQKEIIYAEKIYKSAKQNSKNIKK